MPERDIIAEIRDSLGPIDGETFMRNVRNEDDPEFDEDAAVCDCGHTFRGHHGRAFNYSCARPGCVCTAFRQSDAAAPSGTRYEDKPRGLGEVMEWLGGVPPSSPGATGE